MTDERPQDPQPDEVWPRDPAPGTQSGDDDAPPSREPEEDGGEQPSSPARDGGEDPSSPEAIENDPSTAGGPPTGLPDDVERLRGG
jgi:hypothetical protein